MVTASMKGGDKLMAKLEAMANAKGMVKAGILAKEGGQTGATNAQGKTVMDYAPTLEFGGHGVPPRPFLRTTFVNNNKKWFDQFARTFKATNDVDTALDIVGEMMKMDIIDQIKSNMPPPVSPEWHKRKLKLAPEVANQTLQFTGTLLKSIEYEVEK